MTKILAPIVLASCLIPATAFGAEINLVDPSVGGSLAGHSSASITDPETGVEVTFKAANSGYGSSTLTYNAGDGIGVQTCTNYSCSSDYNYSSPDSGRDDWYDMTDEVDQNESLTISFSEEVTIEKIGLTDIFAGGILWDAWFYLAPNETGTWTLFDSANNQVDDGAFAGTVSRYTSGSNGALTVDVNAVGSLLKLVSTNNSQFKGFSVASISFSTTGVPELGAQGLGASAFLLLGAGILMSDRRRRQLSIEHG